MSKMSYVALLARSTRLGRLEGHLRLLLALRYVPTAPTRAAERDLPAIAAGRAMEYAANVSDGIVLLDGPRLSRLMIEHGVGVTHRPLKAAQVDSDCFDEVS